MSLNILSYLPQNSFLKMRCCCDSSACLLQLFCPLLCCLSTNFCSRLSAAPCPRCSRTASAAACTVVLGRSWGGWRPRVSSLPHLWAFGSHRPLLLGVVLCLHMAPSACVGVFPLEQNPRGQWPGGSRPVLPAKPMRLLARTCCLLSECWCLSNWRGSKESWSFYCFAD